MVSTSLEPQRLGGLDIELAGVALRLLARRALWWPDAATVFVADVHLGKAETFRALGVPVPSGPTEATLRRLGALLDDCGARRLVVLGDLLHARPAQAPATVSALRAWRRAHASLECVLVRGNHDDRAGDPPSDLEIEVVAEPTRLGPFALCHEPLEEAADPASDLGPASFTGPGPGAGSCPGLDPSPAYRLAGHLHPAVRLHGRGGDSARLPCFSVGRTQTVLPAYGDFTGAASVSRASAQRLFAIAGDRVFEVPRAAAGRRGPAFL
jgi:DNA ligase-associated metallophosphoesterase